MAERLVLHPPPALVHRPVGQGDDVIRVGDLDGVGQHRVEHRAIRRRQIQRRPADPLAPAVGSGGEPGARRAGLSRPAITSSSCRGARRRSGSTTPGSGSGRRARTTSRPTRPRRRCRSGPGRRSAAVPHTATASITVCQSQPSSTATSATLRPCRPTCTVAHRASPRRQRAPRRPDRRVGLGPRPATRSGIATAAWATPAAPGDRTPADRPASPRGGHDHAPASRTPRSSACPAVVSIVIRSHRGHSPTPTTRTSGRPTSSAHMRVGSVSNRGSPRLDDVEHRRESQSPCAAPGTYLTPSPHPQIRSAPFGDHSDTDAGKLLVGLPLAIPHGSPCSASSVGTL